MLCTAGILERTVLFLMMHEFQLTVHTFKRFLILCRLLLLYFSEIGFHEKMEL